MSRHRLLVILLVLLGLIVVLGGIVVTALLTVDFRPIIERDASRALQRRVVLGALTIGWGNPLGIELRDVHLANMPGGSEPDMLTIGRLAAEIDLWALLHGELRYDRLRLDGVRILLEHNEAGEKNWRFPVAHRTPASGIAPVPQNRTQFPTLLDFAAQSSTLVYRQPPHRDITIAFDDLTVRSAGVGETVTLALRGAYDGVPTQLDITGGSFATLRDAAVPYPAEVTLKAAPATIGFKGSLTDPLNFDGVTGTLDLDAPALGAFLEMLGAAFRFDAGLHLDGAFSKTGDHWHLGNAAGALASSKFAGSIGLDEGPHGAADALILDLDVPVVDLKKLIAATGPASGPLDKTALRLDEHPGVTIAGRIATRTLVDGNFRLADVTLRGETKPGAVSLDALSLAFAGGEVTAKGSAQAVAGGASRIAADLALSGADADALLRLLGAAPGQIAGRVDASAALAMTGTTLGDALPSLEGQAVLAMSGGRIARALVEKASTDLRTLFRSGEGFAPITCLIGVARIDHGVAQVSPLRLKTADTSFIGGGTVDLANQRVDLTVKTEGAGFFALQLPLHVSGPLAGPGITPLLGGTERGDAAPASPLLPAVQGTAAGNACL